MLLVIAIPFIAALILLATPRAWRFFKQILVVVAGAANLLIAARLFGKEAVLTAPWAGYGIEFSLRLYTFSGFIVAAAAFFSFLVLVYCTAFMRENERFGKFCAYLLLALSFITGAVLSDNLVLMLFFWEGLLLSTYGMITLGRPQAYRTAIKAFIILGITDLCMMLGIILTGHIAGTLAISEINLEVNAVSGLAFALLMIGAISKAGSMPFHTWIPDAAEDAPLAFMAFMPAALEKLLGIYFLTRITLDMFKLLPGSFLSYLMMIIGSCTIIFAVMMALVQKEYKKLLSYHAISQVGYMVLGVGTALPVGIVGGLFHMVNNAIYKSGLFMTAGSVEKQAGTTDLEKLGGLGARMPVTFVCFLICAVSISGVPPFNGFFSKELVYDAALERNIIFYLAALIGSLFTAMSFLKLGHAAFLGKRNKDNDLVRESPIAMLLPMIALSAVCVFFGLYNKFPIDTLIQPVLGQQAPGHSLSGFPKNMALVWATVSVLLAAVCYQVVASKAKGSALKASDYIHYAPVLSNIYEKAEQKAFDLYEIGLKAMSIFSKAAWRMDRAIDWLYERLAGLAVFEFGFTLRNFHTGNYVFYVGWAMFGMAMVIATLLIKVK